MADKNVNEIADRISVADVSSAIAIGLQRALDSRPDSIRDKIVIFGGRIDFNIQMLPQGASGTVRELTNLAQN